MKLSTLFIVSGVVCLLLAACSQTTTDKNPQHKISGVAYPENYRENLVHYATVDRADGTTRDLYISPNALDFLDKRGIIPPNTVIVIEAYDALRDADNTPIEDSQGHFIKGAPMAMLHVLEKREDWSADDFVSGARIGDWNFGSFGVENQQPFDENLTACFNCHNPTPQTDFLYSFPLLARYLRTGQVQYSYCDLPDRLAC